MTTRLTDASAPGARTGQQAPRTNVSRDTHAQREIQREQRLGGVTLQRGALGAGHTRVFLNR